MHAVLSNEKGAVYGGLLVFAIPITMMMIAFLFDWGKGLITRMELHSSVDAASVAGVNQIKKVIDTTSPDGMPETWHFEVDEAKAETMARNTLEKNLIQKKIAEKGITVAETTFSAPQPTTYQVIIKASLQSEFINKVAQTFYGVTSLESIDIYAQAKAYFQNPTIEVIP